MKKRKDSREDEEGNQAKATLATARTTTGKRVYQKNTHTRADTHRRERERGREEEEKNKKVTR